MRDHRIKLDIFIEYIMNTLAMSQLKFGNSDDKNMLSNGSLYVCYRYAN